MSNRSQYSYCRPIVFSLRRLCTDFLYRPLHLLPCFVGETPSAFGGGQEGSCRSRARADRRGRQPRDGRSGFAFVSSHLNFFDGAHMRPCVPYVYHSSPHSHLIHVGCVVCAVSESLELILLSSMLGRHDHTNTRTERRHGVGVGGRSWSRRLRAAAAGGWCQQESQERGVCQFGLCVFVACVSLDLFFGTF
jgi:hypothetical protein